MSIYIPTTQSTGGGVSQASLTAQLSTKANVASNTSFAATNASITNLTLTNKINTQYMRGLINIYETNSANQTVGSGAYPVIVNNMSTNTVNQLGSDISVSLSNSRFTYTGSVSRFWTISYTLGSNNCIGGGVLTVMNAWISKNANYTVRYGQTSSLTNNTGVSICAGGPVFMNPNDYIELCIFQTNPSLVSINISSTFFNTTFNITE